VFIGILILVYIVCPVCFVDLIRASYPAYVHYPGSPTDQFPASVQGSLEKVQVLEVAELELFVPPSKLVEELS